MRTSAKIRILGYVGKNPVIPNSNNPNFVTFSVSVNSKRLDKQTKETIQTTSWYECHTGTESTAKRIQELVKKGSAILIDGIPKFEAYIDKGGKPQATCKVYIIDFDILSYSENNQQTSSQQKLIIDQSQDDDDDGIPF